MDEVRPWEMSSSGGMSITACVDTRFDFVKETADKNSTQGISNIPKESLLDNKSYIHGLTQDDSFSDNSFANLILGSRLTLRFKTGHECFYECPV
ncbi:MAG: hypothetical protein IPG21_15030 [Saprospiraceae bacterium]|nr:hypothetical protein [Candidatus Vicinibacter affinis]